MYLCGLVISLWIEHGGTQLNKWQAVVEPLHAAWQSTTRRQVDRREQRTLGENCLHWLQAYWRATKVQSSNKTKPISIECPSTTPLGKSCFKYLQADWGATQVQSSLHNQTLQYRVSQGSRTLQALPWLPPGQDIVKTY